jgi:hypothetical protein
MCGRDGASKKIVVDVRRKKEKGGRRRESRYIRKIS